MDHPVLNRGLLETPEFGNEDGVMHEEQRSTARRYTREQKDQAVRLVRSLREETGERFGAVKRVAEQLGYGVESVRSWVAQADIDEGVRPGTTSDDADRIKKLEQENRELRRANEILRRASAFFAAELDRPQK
jgi:transposase